MLHKSKSSKIKLWKFGLLIPALALFLMSFNTKTILIEKEKKNIFKRFYRIGNEETRRSKGTGLGLYIVNRIVEKNNGSIKVKNNTPQGTIFNVEIEIK
jgi:signal transduction histidine kinase